MNIYELYIGRIWDESYGMSDLFFDIEDAKRAAEGFLAEAGLISLFCIQWEPNRYGDGIEAKFFGSARYIRPCGDYGADEIEYAASIRLRTIR